MRAMPTLPLKLAERARVGRADPAVVTDDATLNWQELASLSFRLSSHLRRRGVCKGDRVALMCGNRPAYLICWFAAANIGAITVTVSTALVGDGLRYALAQSGSTFLIIEACLHDALGADIEKIDHPPAMLRFFGG